MRHSLSHSTCTCLSDSCWPRGNEHVDSYIQNPQSKWSWSLILIMIWSLFKMWSFKRSDQNQKKDLDLWSWSLKKWSYPSMVRRDVMNKLKFRTNIYTRARQWSINWHFCLALLGLCSAKLADPSAVFDWIVEFEFDHLLFSLLSIFYQDWYIPLHISWP